MKPARSQNHEHSAKRRKPLSGSRRTARRAGRTIGSGILGLPRHDWIVVGILIAAVALVFGRIVRNDYVSWDDRINIFENPYLNPPTFDKLSFLWTHSYKSLYIPLVYTSYALEIAVAGMHAWEMHLVNLLLHAVNAFLVFQILAIVLPRAGKNSFPFPALAGALVFALHPFQVESVAWATGRKDVLSGFFALLSLFLYIKWRVVRKSQVQAEQSDVAQQGTSDAAETLNRSLLYAGALVSFFLALLAKPAVVALPLAAMAIDWFLLGVPILRSLTGLAPWFVMAGGWTLLTSHAQPVPEALLTALPPTWTRPLVAADALFFYLKKIVAPIGFAPVYARTPKVAIEGAWVWGRFILVVCIVAAAVSRRGIWAAAVCVFIAFVLPVLGLVPFGFQTQSTVADRYIYASMLGIAMAVAAALILAEEKWPKADARIRAAMGAILLLLGALSFRQASFWKDSCSLWLHNLSVAPRAATAHLNYGQVLAKEKAEDKAMEYFKEATRLNPSYGEAFNNIGLVLFHQDKIEEAVKQWQRAIECSRTYADPYANLGDAYARLGKDEEAIRMFRLAMHYEPSHYQAHINLSSALMRQGKTEEAAQTLRDLLAITPNLPLAHRNLGIVLTQLEKPDEALAELELALKLDPSDQQVRAAIEKLRPTNEQ